MFFQFSNFEFSGFNGNNGHVFTKKPELAFRVLKAISGIKFYFFLKFFSGFFGFFLSIHEKLKTWGQFPFRLPEIPFSA